MNNGKTKKETKIKIDFKKIPKEEVRAMARAVLDDVIEFYKNPENVHTFNEWLKNRKKS